MNNPNFDCDESVRLFRLLKDRTRSHEERLDLFDQLLWLDRGFWISGAAKQTLRAFMLRTAYWVKRIAIEKGARGDAIDDETLADDVLLEFFERTDRIKSPRAWLIATAKKMLKCQLGKEWHVFFGKEIDDPDAHVSLSVDTSPHVDRTPHDVRDERDEDEDRMRRVSHEVGKWLSPKQQQVLALYEEGKTSREIGAIVGMKPEAVRQLMLRLKRLLKTLVEAVNGQVRIAAERSAKKRTLKVDRPRPTPADAPPAKRKAR